MMTPSRMQSKELRKNHQWWFGIAAIGVVGFAIRAFYIRRYASHVAVGGDSYFFYYWPAVQLARGQGYLDAVSVLYGYRIPGAEHPPGLILLLAGLYRLGFESMNAMRYALAALGSVTVVLVGVFGKRFVSRRAGIIAALLAATYPNVWFHDTAMMSETLMMFGFVIALIGIYELSRQCCARNVFLASCGVLIAGSSRPEMLVFLPLIVLPLIWVRARRNAWRMIKLGAIACALPGLALVGWVSYNTGRFAHPYFLSTGFGQTFQVGTCDATFSGESIGAFSLACGKTYSNGTGSPTAAQPTPEQRAAYAKSFIAIRRMGAGGTLPVAHLGDPPPLGKRKDQSIDSQVFIKRTVRYLSSHTRKVPTVVLAREGRTVGLWNPTAQVRQDSYINNRPRALVGIAQWMFWVLSLASLVGAWIWRRRQMMLAPLVLEVVLTMAVVAITFGETRYRAGVEIVIVLLAATAIDHMWQRFAGRKKAASSA